jgi:hypothetical protein
MQRQVTGNGAASLGLCYLTSGNLRRLLAIARVHRRGQLSGHPGVGRDSPSSGFRSGGARSDPCSLTTPGLPAGVRLTALNEGKSSAGSWLILYIVMLNLDREP